MMSAEPCQRRFSIKFSFYLGGIFVNPIRLSEVTSLSEKNIFKSSTPFSCLVRFIYIETNHQIVNDRSESARTAEAV